MSEIWDERKKAQEEEYFRRKEQEAIEKMRARRTAEAAAASALRCPKCQGALAEITHEGVQVDRCTQCNGVWLDAGELERLTERDEGGFFGRLFGSASNK
jgi:Zn-finger nucleic acid-binding protein